MIVTEPKVTTTTATRKKPSVQRVAHALDVGCHARHQLARLRLVMVREAEALQVIVELVAQVIARQAARHTARGNPGHRRREPRRPLATSTAPAASSKSLMRPCCTPVSTTQANSNGTTSAKPVESSRQSVVINVRNQCGRSRFRMRKVDLPVGFPGAPGERKRRRFVPRPRSTPNHPFYYRLEQWQWSTEPEHSHRKIVEPAREMRPTSPVTPGRCLSYHMRRPMALA